MISMDKSSHSAGESTSSNSSSSNRDQYLKNLNKLSHKISKPIIKKPTFDNHSNQQQNQINGNPPPLPPQNQAQPLDLQQQQQLQHQPPVYNINKSDFRDVVQRLTGLPVHERFSTPPPIQPPKPTSSRLQKIRPPPLPQLSTRPPPLVNQGPTDQLPNVTSSSEPGNFIRPIQPFSPLPPFPAVHAAAESPISAYMRYLQSSSANTDSDLKRFSGFSPLAPLVSPRWNNFAQPPVQPQQHNVPPSSTAEASAPFQFPLSPLPFGCLPSPRSPYPSQFSPTNLLGFQQFPLSPTVPVPNPRWKGV